MIWVTSSLSQIFLGFQVRKRFILWFGDTRVFSKYVNVYRANTEYIWPFSTEAANIKNCKETKIKRK